MTHNIIRKIQSDSNTLPKRNIKANSIENVYKIEDIIPNPIMNELKQSSKV